jgi:hypothetical protein
MCRAQPERILGEPGDHHDRYSTAPGANLLDETDPHQIGQTIRLRETRMEVQEDGTEGWPLPIRQTDLMTLQRLRFESLVRKHGKAREHGGRFVVSMERPRQITPAARASRDD